MISITEEKTVREYSGLSTDEKPTGDDIENGAAFLEMDTSTLYLYDKENEQWRAWKKSEE